jgi:hypothetical protein
MSALEFLNEACNGEPFAILPGFDTAYVDGPDIFVVDAFGSEPQPFSKEEFLQELSSYRFERRSE